MNHSRTRSDVTATLNELMAGSLQRWRSFAKNCHAPVIAPHRLAVDQAGGSLEVVHRDERKGVGPAAESRHAFPDFCGGPWLPSPVEQLPAGSKRFSCHAVPSPLRGKSRAVVPLRRVGALTRSTSCAICALRLRGERPTYACAMGERFGLIHPPLSTSRAGRYPELRCPGGSRGRPSKAHWSCDL